MEVKNISVNGLPLIHNVGDYPYTIEFGKDDNDNFTPTVSTVPRSIDSVRIKKNRIDWLDDEGYILATTMALQIIYSGVEKKQKDFLKNIFLRIEHLLRLQKYLFLIMAALKKLI